MFMNRVVSHANLTATYYNRQPFQEALTRFLLLIQLDVPPKAFPAESKQDYM